MSSKRPGRPKKSVDEARLRSLLASGRSAAEIAADMGLGQRTIERRIAAIKGPTSPLPLKRPGKTEAVPPAPPSQGDIDDLPEDADAVPEGTDLETLDRWIKRAEDAGRRAAAEGNLAGIGAMGRLASTLYERKRKMAPPVVPDPNDDPELIKLAETARNKLREYIDQALGKR